MVSEAGTFGLGTLGTLILMSLITWAIMLERSMFYRGIGKKSRQLMAMIQKNGLFPTIHEAEPYMPSPEAAVLHEASVFVSSGNRHPSAPVVVEDPLKADVERARMRALLDARALNQIGLMEKNLILLSTTASAAPFIGLLGTTVGIMHSFLSMSGGSGTGLDVIGPGIAEALVSTAAGLAAAIPALMGYNMLVRNVHRKSTEIELFVERVVEGTIVSDAVEFGERTPQRVLAGAVK
jgi:biopolymer transport protein TolQ